MSKRVTSPVIRKVLDAMDVMDQVRDIHIERARTPAEREKAVADHSAIMGTLADMLHKAQREADEDPAI
jgi:hypothetical protein